MSIKPFLKLYRNDQLSALLGINPLFKPFYKLTYLAAMQDTGLLERLSGEPLPFEKLAEGYCRDDKSHEALEAWLQLGVRLGLLKNTSAGYMLKGLAKTLSLPHNDAALALLQEVAGLHYNLISKTPEKLRNGALWSLADQDGELIARSSRVLEAFQTEAIDKTFPVAGAVRLLEVGCGSAFYIRYAAERNPSLTALGLELQPDVADMARRNITQWGLHKRVQIETGGICEKPAEASFDIVTLYNNIYYFPVAQRIALLRHLRQFIKAEGFLLLTTCCQGGNLGIEVLNLWGAATATGGRLPDVEEMMSQLREASYRDVRAISLVAGDRFYAFKARQSA